MVHIAKLHRLISQDQSSLMLHESYLAPSEVWPAHGMTWSLRQVFSLSRKASGSPSQAAITCQGNACVLRSGWALSLCCVVSIVIKRKRRATFLPMVCDLMLRTSLPACHVLEASGILPPGLPWLVGAVLALF
jgi:hypothetical protein